jgi:hypothetical protein
MTTHDRRLHALETLFQESEDAASPRPRPNRELWAILDELASLKASRAVGYRGGVRIEPEDIPQKILGPDYTRPELWELAIARGLEKQGYSTEEIAELLPRWVEWFGNLDRRDQENPSVARDWR